MRPESSSIADYLTVKQAAEVLGVSPSTLRNWDRNGKLRAFRHPLNQYRLYRLNDLREILQAIRLVEESEHAKYSV